MIRIHEWLRQSEVFSSLSAEGLDRLACSLHWRDYYSGDMVCHQGEPASSMFTVVAGRLEVLGTACEAGEPRLGEIEPCDIFGEMALLAGEPRAANVRAIRDTTAVELDEAHYRDLLRTNPQLIQRITGIAFKRLRSSAPRRPSLRAQTVAVVSIRPGFAKAPIVARVSDALSVHLRTTSIDSRAVVNALGPASTSSERGSDQDREVICWLSALERDVDCVLYVCDDEDTAWTRRCLRQADRVLLLADADSHPALSSLEQQLFGNPHLAPRVPRTLALFHDRNSESIAPAWQWSEGRELERMDFVQLPDTDDLRRLARGLTESALAPAWLRESVLFSPLEAADLQPVMAALDWIDLKGQDVLFRQGDKGDSLFILVSGRLQALIRQENGSEFSCGEMGPGEIIGEIALVTGEARSATVRALRDSKLVRLSRPAFDRLAASRPELVFQLSRVIVDRLSGKRRMTKVPRSVNFAVLALSPDMAAAETINLLKHGFSRLGRTKTLSAAVVESRLGAGSIQREPREVGDSMLVEWLNDYESHHDYLLYQCDQEDSPWTRRCLRQADRILLLARANSGSGLTRLERALFERHELGSDVSRYLVLVQAAAARQAVDTSRWLEPRRLAGHYHLRSGNPSDAERLARLLTNRALGLVMGGGGSRGVAHVGVYRAILEAGLNVDIVSGTSAGAAIAGLVAMGDDPGTMLAKVEGMLTRPMGHLLGMGPPFVSLMSGGHPTRLLAPWFGDARIEDQLIPCAIVSTDLASGEQCVHREGGLHVAARASSALPAAWPPVVEGSRVLVDGGVLNNLPVDVIESFCTQGAIIASDIAGGGEFSGFDTYGLQLSGWSILGRKLWPFTRRPRLPSIMGVIARCCVLGSLSHVQQVLRDKQILYLQPPVLEYGMFDIRTTALIREVESLTRDYAGRELEQWLRRSTSASAANQCDNALEVWEKRNDAAS